MAIEKVEKKKVELTKEALFQLIGAGVMVLLSLILGWFAISNWRAKSALVAGFQAYEGNNSGNAKRELQDAVRLKPDHVGALEVLAKLACDAGGPELSTAEDYYRRVRSAAQNQNVDSTAAKIGMGVIYLKHADKATASKEILDLVGKAQAEFRTAPEVPEGEIGLGHCELLLASKLGDPKRLAAAAEIFKRVRTSLGNRDMAAKISRDGLLDYYSGLGRVLAASEKPEELKEACDSFQSCLQLARRWEVARADLMLAEARRWSVWKGSAAEIAALEPEMSLLRKTQLIYWKDSRESALVAAHKIPWMAFSVAFAQALARVGNIAGAGAIFGEIRTNTNYNEVPDPLLIESKFRCDLALREGLKPSEQDTAVRDALSVFDPLFKRLGTATDDVTKDRMARSLNNQAVMRSLQGSSGYAKAKEHLTDALKLFPDEYVYNRNLALVLKRSKAPPAGIQAALDKAKAAATGKLAEDFDKVQKVIEEK